MTAAPATPAELLARLDGLGIRVRTHEHAAVFTVAESAPLRAAMPGAHTKNLFLKDRRGRLFLVVAKDDARVDLKRLHEALGASGRVSFGSADALRDVLGIEPGSVSPLAAVNDVAGRVTVVLDRTLMEFDVVNVHPLVNTMTAALAPGDLVRFLRATGHEPAILSLPGPDDRNCEAPASPPS